MVVAGMAVEAAGMAAARIGTAVVGMVEMVGITVVTVAAGELDPR
jgi:hypothetical protein